MKILNIIFCGILIIFPTFIFADWEEDRACLQTLICNVNGQFLKDNEDNRVCIGKAVLAQKNKEVQDTDPPPMCLSQQQINLNPRIDYTVNRTVPIPPGIPAEPNNPPLNFVFFITPQLDLGATQTPGMYYANKSWQSARRNGDTVGVTAAEAAFALAVQRRDAGAVPGFEHLAKLPGETAEQHYNRAHGVTPVPTFK